MVAQDLKSIAIRSIHCMATGTRADFDAVVHAQGFTHERRAAPPSARGAGPEAFEALAMWLRNAFADLHYDIHLATVEGDVVSVNSTMNGRHVSTIVFYTEDGQVDSAFPSTGRTFAITQSHWFLFKDGKIVEHWANRDDLGQAKQLGWLPPTPAYLARMALAKRRAKRR
jgi:predicted ester cyclase